MNYEYIYSIYEIVAIFLSTLNEFYLNESKNGKGLRRCLYDVFTPVMIAKNWDRNSRGHKLLWN